MSREKQIEEINRDLYHNTTAYNTCWEEDCEELAVILYNLDYRKIPENIGEFSDGYHTFNELYHHRAVLFSVICNMFPNKAWKSKLHDTGDMFDGMFIVGIETEQGQATYHYDIEPYWDMFKVKELAKAPKWDGHTPSEAIERIGKMSVKPSEGGLILTFDGATGYFPKEFIIEAIKTHIAKKSEWISVDERLPETNGRVLACDSEGDISTATFARVGMQGLWFTSAIGRNQAITHWMPLPEAPKGGGE